MTHQENNEPAAFAGTQRAVGYVEAEHTMRDEEVREIRAAAAERDDEEPANVEPASSEPAGIRSRRGEISPPPQPLTVPASQSFAPAATPADMLAEPFSELATATTADKPAVASKGMRGALSRIGIRMAPGAAEAAELDAAAARRSAEQIIRQATWTRAVSVLVANPKGGTGKTPCALLLGGVLAAVRGGSVAVMEVSDDPGALTFRAEGNPPRGIGELVRDVAGIRTAGQLAGYTAPQTSFASVIGSTGRRDRLTRENVVDVAGAVDEFYGIRVMDSGNQPSSSAFQGAIETADALVIPVLNAGDAVLEAVALLDVLRAAGGKAVTLADNAIVVRLTDGRPEHPQVVERVNRIIAGANVRQVFEVPYDAHISDRGQLTLDSLAPATRQAFTVAAAGVVSYLQQSIR
jgi:MinD-like ATPase involved in chromosome partitioning or flagellar assembly